MVALSHRYAVGIPAYNEENSLAKVIVKSRKFADEVIVVDDGSTDSTAAIADALGVTLIRHGSNMGKGEAMRSIFRKAKELGVDILVTIDADGQHNPDEIPRLVEIILNGNADVVIGSRFLGSEVMPAYRKAGNRMLNILTANQVTDTQSGFRAYGKRAVQTILPAEMGMGVDSEILIEALRSGLKVAEVPVSVSYGIGKTSTHNPVFHTVDVAFSVIKLASMRHPLIFYGLPGLGLTIVGIVLALRTYVIFGQTQITNLTLTYGILSLGLVFIGLLVLLTGVILFTLVSVVRKQA